MEKIKARRVDFDHFTVIKLSNNYFAVLDGFGKEVTSGESLNSAAKKAKLLEIGFNVGKDYYNY